MIAAIPLKGEAAMIAAIPLHPALRIIERSMDGYVATFHDLKFVVSMDTEEDGKEWLHASVSRRDRQMPTYEDLQTLKRLTIGEDKYAYQVFPPKEKHFNLQVLHLWSCIEGPALPDFTRGGDTI